MGVWDGQSISPRSGDRQCRLTVEGDLSSLIHAREVERQAMCYSIYTGHPSLHSYGVSYPGDGDKAGLQARYLRLRYDAGNEPAHESHRQHTVGKHILHTRTP